MNLTFYNYKQLIIKENTHYVDTNCIKTYITDSRAVTTLILVKLELPSHRIPA